MSDNNKFNEVLNKAIVALFSTKERSFEDIVTEGSELITEVTGITRCILWRSFSENGEEFAREIYRYDKQSGGEIDVSEEFAKVVWRGRFARWHDLFMKNVPINSPVNLLPEAEKEPLTELGAKSLAAVPLFTDGAFWGVALFEDRETERFFSDEELDFLKAMSYLYLGAAVQADMVSNVKSAAAELGSRESLMETLNSAAVIFSSGTGDNFGATMARGIKKIADAVGLDRVAVYRSYQKDGEPYVSQIYRWDKVAGGTTEIEPSVKNLRFADVSYHWSRTLTRGEHINAPSYTMGGREAAFMKTYGVKSLMIAPVMRDGACWGVVTFQDHTTERFFDNKCVETLKSAAYLCANEVLRADAQKSLSEKDELYSAMFEQQPLGCSIMSPEGLCVDCNDLVLELCKAPDKRTFTERWYDFSPEYQPDGSKSAVKAKENIDRAMKDGAYVFQWLHQTSEREPIPCEITLIKVMFKDSHLLLGYHYDLRNLKKMSDAFRDAFGGEK